ncbi:S41 family peptidase [uncultured Winogradskyella sp.]|uniref:S41 family peptidase n=1 Tax=uncultured Winogradskyella sp. TaxID=395353 RepID=UPI0026371D2B|nr:S41 family peptidase [uncultured Winogradskyella sp.]
MKKLVNYLLVVLVTIASVNAQIETCDCKTDLDFVIEKMKKMPSYKKQTKGDKAKEFENLYTKLTSQMVKPIGVEACYKMLLQQMALVNDVHASLKVNTAFLPKSYLEDTEKIKSFKASALYKNHPKTNKHLLDLDIDLKNKPLEHKEGIYNLGDNEKIGLYAAGNTQDFIGVLMETNLEHWTPGEIRFYLKHTNANKYNMYFYDANTRTPSLVQSLSFENGRIWRYKKEGNTLNNELLSEKIEVAAFKQINDNTQYLYFATFGNSKRKELKAFFNDTKSKLTADHIIVDLRSNVGGNKKFSNPFLKLLKTKNVYVLTNCFTGSNGEQFTLKLLKNKKAKHLGQTTRGIIAYGKNYGYSYATPSGHFQITPTDMNFHSYFDYEGKGVVPEIKLDFDKDWIEQTIDIINAN